MQTKNQLLEEARETISSLTKKKAYDPRVPTFTGKIAGYDVETFGFLQNKSRICLVCRDMNDPENSLINEELHLPCRHANKGKLGHWWAFPAGLEKIYTDLRKKKNE